MSTAGGWAGRAPFADMDIAATAGGLRAKDCVTTAISLAVPQAVPAPGAVDQIRGVPAPQIPLGAGAAEGLAMPEKLKIVNEGGQISGDDQQRIQFGDQIKVNGKPIRVRIAPPPARVIAYHKPEGRLVTRRDPEGRETVFAQLPFLRGGRWIAVGRLDLNTSGLLLLTDSGELANRLMHPRYGIEREYMVRALGRLEAAERQALLTGVTLEDGRAAFDSLEPAGTAKTESAANRWYRASLREGRKREVRRMFEAVGLRVSRLIRTRFGPLELPGDLPPGQMRELAHGEVRALMERLGLAR